MKIKPILAFVASAVAMSANAYVQDADLSDYRANSGNSDVWNQFEDSKAGLGDVGSSGDTAFGQEGSSRFRFKKNVSNHDYSAKPGLSQVLSDLPTNTEMTYSLYYCDKKGANSVSNLYFGVREAGAQPLAGKVIAEKRVHTRELTGAPKGEVKSCFKQVAIDFKTPANGQVEIFSLLEIDQNGNPNPRSMKELEVRVDNFAVVKK